MKFYQLPCILFLLFTSLNAGAQLRFAPEGGFNLCSFLEPNTGGTHFLAGRVAYRIGVTIDHNICPHLYLQPALFYVKKGYAGSTPDITHTKTLFDNFENIDYFELPVRLQYKSKVPGTNRFIAGVGVYAAYAFHANVKTHDQEWGTPLAFELEIGNKKTDLVRPFDLGCSLNMGFEFKGGMFTKLYYNYGFTTVNQQFNSAPHNTEWGLSTGYFLPFLHRKKPIG